MEWRQITEREKLTLTTISVIDEHPVITNNLLGNKDHFRKQINSVVTNPSYNKQNSKFRAVCCN